MSNSSFKPDTDMSSGDVHLQREGGASIFVERRNCKMCLREEDGSCLHNHTLPSLGGNPPHHHHHHFSHIQSLPPPPPSVWAFLSEDLQNNGVTSCSRSQCFQQSFQAGAHLNRGSVIYCEVSSFLNSQHKDFFHIFFCVMSFYVVWLFPCFDVYMRGINRPTMVFPT